MAKIKIKITSALRVPVLVGVLQRHAGMGDCEVCGGALEFPDYEGAQAVLGALQRVHAETQTCKRAQRALTRRINDAILEAAGW